MATSKSDLENAVKEIFRYEWSTRKGRVVPDPEDIVLGNSAVVFDHATVLYADLSRSTSLVESADWTFAAEIYKAYLHCAATIIRNEGGEITSYDGDRVMGIFVGEVQATPAARAGLKINYAVQKIINPALRAQYSTKYEVKQVVGIDRSKVRAARTGVRGDNDIVWVGRAANYAAKLTDLDLAERTWITKEAYDRLHSSATHGGNNNSHMWKSYKWSQMNDQPIYGSTWTWTV
ncbi:adenylate/guanylate cyclase domain-containing protein [Cucumibacter marinus]|uniref:adenylate/guanylate cyclase domain-containing protein n=1 Tax=Cucumibacter marinus TaxID=1121252 RepID=UPI00048BD978|nr:adenylate/guanylate cyclase domain-containing protein [Cucumibacter marinus]